MNKSLKHILLPASEEAWELWVHRKGKLHLEKQITDLASQSLPKDTRVAFPANAVATLPLNIPPAEIETQKSMAMLQLEQSGLLKPDLENWDILRLSIDDQPPIITGLVLINDPQANVSSNLSTEHTFDLAARYYDVGDLDLIVCKKEQGTWVTLFYKDASPFYLEQLDSLSSLDSQLRSLLIQLSVQGISFTPAKILIEQEDSWLAENAVLVSKLEQTLGLDLEVETRESIQPTFRDQKDLNLIPSFIAQARRKKKRNQKIRFFILLSLCLYIIAGLLLFKKHKERENKIQQAKQEVTNLMPQWLAHQQDMSKINELDPVLTNHWPLASFEKIVSHLPSNQELRFQVVEIQSSYILIKGISPNINLINALYPLLKEDPYFSQYTWRMPAPTIDPKTKLWSFTIEALTPTKDTL